MKVSGVDWKTKASLKIGCKGTSKEYAKYGESLICVRYRYDENSRKRIKTVELIIEEVELPKAIAKLHIRIKKYACREFKAHEKSVTTCVNCGWQKTDHQQFKGLKREAL